MSGSSLHSSLASGFTNTDTQRDETLSKLQYVHFQKKKKVLISQTKLTLTY